MSTIPAPRSFSDVNLTPQLSVEAVLGQLLQLSSKRCMFLTEQLHSIHLMNDALIDQLRLLAHMADRETTSHKELKHLGVSSM